MITRAPSSRRAAKSLGAAALVFFCASLAGDDPRWRLRAAVRTYLDSIQSAREVRIDERLRQVELDRAFARWAASLCEPEVGLPLRQKAEVLVFKESLHEGRKRRLIGEDRWTRELPDGSFEQSWVVKESVRKPSVDESGRRVYIWDEQATPLIFRAQARPDGQMRWCSRPEDLASEPDKLPTRLALLLGLLGPDARPLPLPASELGSR